MELEYATTGQRFGNYIIDVISFFVLAVIYGIILALVSPETLDGFESDSSSPMGNLLDRLISLIIFGIYMGLIEGITKGKSLGKLITGTRAINEETRLPVSFKEAMLRGLCSMVPFDNFSALGNPSYPWHDKWTATCVVTEKSLRNRF